MKPTRRKQKPKREPTEEQRERLRKEVADWYLVAKSLVDQLYHMTCRMGFELRKPESPLAEFLDQDEVASLSSWLDQAGCKLSDIVVDVGVDLPDPISVVREMRN